MATDAPTLTDPVSSSTQAEPVDGVNEKNGAAISGGTPTKEVFEDGLPPPVVTFKTWIVCVVSLTAMTTVVMMRSTNHHISRDRSFQPDMASPSGLCQSYLRLEVKYALT